MNITNLANDTPVEKQIEDIAEFAKKEIERDANIYKAQIDSALAAAKTKAEEISRFTKLNVLDLAGAVFFGTFNFDIAYGNIWHDRLQLQLGGMRWNTADIEIAGGRKYKITLLVTEEKDGK